MDQAVIAPSQPSSDNPAPARIIVVDDDPGIRDVVHEFLSRHGYEVETAPDAAGLYRPLQRAPADLVVLDLMLPGIDGLEVCRLIQRDRPVPVLMLTARDSEDDLVVGLAVVADA